jgi:predicted dehydrogenase
MSMPEPPAHTAPAASRRLAWGVLGDRARTGGARRSAAVIAALRHATGARLLGVVDAADDGLVESRGAERLYASPQTLLDDPEVACVYLAPPAGLELEWVLRAAEAGKHILCAPPLALDIAELDEMEAACHAAGVTLMEAVAPLFHPRLDRMRDLLARRVIGAVAHLAVESGSQVTFDSYGRALIAPDANALLDLGGCGVAALRALLGAEPEIVTASAQYGPTGAEIDIEAYLEFPGGVGVQLICSLISAGATEWLAISGEAGAISVPHPAFTVGPGDPSPICVHLTGAPELDVLRGPPADACRLMIEAFSAAILRGEPAPYPLAESRATLRILEALSLSARAGAATQLSSP